jgi:crotonobetainyl-CoA:carnitine CoA-transferase CaiB-like acyl-CoA transferase
MLLADQGADVIKIESPSRWDPNRCAVQPARGRERDWWNTCAYFTEYNRNKRSLALEIAHPRGREVLAALVHRADVVIENYRAGVLDRLGIGYGLAARAARRRDPREHGRRSVSPAPIASGRATGP